MLEYLTRTSDAMIRPRVMGILNVTPDSFSDGGRFNQIDQALARAEQMAAEGADILDVGGESTRPGAQPVTEAQEMDRVVPVIEALAKRIDVAISIDTSKPAVMRAAVEAGAGMVNDVNALRADQAVETVAALGVPVCLMHMQGAPRSMQQNPRYRDVVSEVRDFLLQRSQVCIRAGIADDAIMLDPGFGFGKTLEHNLALLRGLPSLAKLRFPLLAGLSRKSMLGALTGRDVEHRLAGSLAVALESLHRGARILRVHDVAETVDVVKIFQALQQHQIERNS